MLNHHQTSWTFPHSVDVCSTLLTKTVIGGYFYHHLPLFLRHISCKLSIHHFIWSASQTLHHYHGIPIPKMMFSGDPSHLSLLHSDTNCLCW